MARLPALTAAIAAQDGRPLQVIENYARTIREAGLLPTTKRGLGASAMSIGDAANLLIALNSSETAAGAPASVARIRSLRPRLVGTDEGLFPALTQIQQPSDFGEALTWLISCAPQIVYTVAILTKAEFGDEWSKNMSLIQRVSVIEVSIRSRHYAAIKANWRLQNGVVPVFEQDFVVDPNKLMAGFYDGPDRDADRKVTMSFGLPSIVSAWTAVHDGASIFAEAGVDRTTTALAGVTA